VQPEPGDKSIHVTAEVVAAGVCSVGVGPGDLVMFHSSLSSLGDVVGGPTTIIEGFLQAVAPDGTVAVPTLWWTGKGDLSGWDPETSPSYPGVITETFRQRPASLRSNNPTHSVSAIGPRAAELTADHGKFGLRPCIFGDTAFAAASPWERFYQWNAAYCFVGVDFTVNTMGHYCETMMIQWALGQTAPEKRAPLEARVGRFETFNQWPHVVWASFPFQKMGEHLAELGLVRFGKIGSATIRCIRAREMVDATLATLQADPEEWFSKPEFLEWLKEALG
jgi:aminoglycoside 3-N-acetyltransferase